MRQAPLLLLFLWLGNTLSAQYVYTINADSVKITNHCDTAELIIENHTQNVPGFLFNKGRGRTEFRRVMQKLDPTTYLIGGDTLFTSPNAWMQGGNTFGTTGILGTLDNNHLDIYTNNTQRARFTTTGNLLVGTTADNGYRLQLSGIGGVYVDPNLSRPDDRIRFGGYLNPTDGQNRVISISNDGGNNYNAVMVERDGYIGIGNSGIPGNGWNVGSPAIRILPAGGVGVTSPAFYLGRDFNGPGNVSRLVMTVSNTNEWNLGESYPNGQNTYYFGTQLGSINPATGYKRAPLQISGRRLHFLTGDPDVEAAQISEAGNVLLGTTSDNGHKLQVTGTTFSNIFTNSPTPLGTPDDGALRLRWGGGGGSYIDFYYQGNTDKRGFVSSPADGRPLYISDQVGISLSQTPYLALGTEVGFAKLSVANPVASGMHTMVLVRTEQTAYDFMASAAGNIVIGSNADNGNKFQVNGNSYFSGSVRFAGLTPDSSQTRVLVSDANGNLFYRNLSSWATNNIFNADIAIKGKLSARQINLMPAAWADYVFDKNYHLPSLPDVENYIRHNNRLPGIPSAAEVQQKGIDVGENQAALLKKIEELMLYIIEQDKKVQKQNEEINDLKELNKKFSSLEQQVNELKKNRRK